MKRKDYSTKPKRKKKNTQTNQRLKHIVRNVILHIKCSLDAAKRGFYRIANSIFRKVGHVASHDVILHLIKSKCIPILLYGLEAIPLK